MRFFESATGKLYPLSAIKSAHSERVGKDDNGFWKLKYVVTMKDGAQAQVGEPVFNELARHEFAPCKWLDVLDWSRPGEDGRRVEWVRAADVQLIELLSGTDDKYVYALHLRGRDEPVILAGITDEQLRIMFGNAEGFELP